MCHSFKNPVCIVTKGALIVRDTELLSDLHAEAHVEVFISIPCLDNDIAKAIEPYAPRPAVRLRAMKKLSEAGVPVGVAIAPIIPGLTDSHIAKVLESAHSAGARSAFMTMLRLPREVKPVFLDNAKRLFPTKFTKISNALREARDGELNTTKFGARMRGEGARWSAIEQLFRVTTERLGYRRSEETVPNNRNTFQRPNQQLSLSLS